MCVCVCVCVCERERESVCVREGEKERECVCIARDFLLLPIIDSNLLVQCIIAQKKEEEKTA